MTEIFVDIIGWIGAGAVLAAYWLISTHRLHGSSFIYQLLNIVGSLFLAINTLFRGAYPSMGVNILWVGIGIYALLGIIQNRRAAQDSALRTPPETDNEI